MMIRMSLAKKLFVTFLILTIVVIATASMISFRQSRASLEKAAFERLTSVREMKASQIEAYLELINNQVITFSGDRMVVAAMHEFQAAFRRLQQDIAPDPDRLDSINAGLADYYESEFLVRLAPNLEHKPAVGDYLPRTLNATLLQHLYVSANPYNTGSKSFLDDAKDGSLYSQVHRDVHPILREYVEKFGYYDLFLIDIDGGEIVYSVFKEVDVGTSLLEGPYADTGLSRVFRAARNSSSADFVAIDDFEPYHPSYNRPAAFIASPIFNGDEKIGVLALQMPIDRINEIMTNDQNWSNVGLGESGETYIVAHDYRLRNQSRFLIEDSENYFRMIEEMGMPQERIKQIRNLQSSIGLQEVRTEGTEAALAGQTDTRIFDDYRGVSVLSSYRPLQRAGLKWVIMSEIDEAEAFAAIGDLARKLLFTAAWLLLFTFVASVAVSRTITRPLLRLSDNSRALARGDLEVRIDTSGGDEIGELARDFDNMRQSLKSTMNELEELNVGLEQKVAQRTVELESSERRIKAIIETASQAILVANEKMEILLWNPAAEDMFGMTAEQAAGKSIPAFIPDAYRDRHSAAFAEAVQRGGLKNPAVTHELSARHVDGREIPVELTLGTWEIAGKRYFSALIRDITERKEMEQEIEQANKRMLEELNFARDIQMSMLPLLFPAFPERSELSLDSILEPAREVGGDFYDFYFLDEQRLCMVMADVSGKGAPAALFMAVSKTLIKMRATNDFDASSILTHVNGELSENNTTCTFVTVFLGILDITNGLVQYCNAGHNPPYIKRSSGSLEKLDALHGPVLGALPEVEYAMDEVVLEAGDMLLMFTDGVTEAMNERDEEYTDQRLENLLSQSQAQIPNELTVEILEDVRSHKGDAEQSDDITLLAVMYQGPEAQQGGHLDVRIKNRMQELEYVEQQFGEYAARNAIPASDRQMLSMVMDDLLNNIISYAYPMGGEHVIHMDLSLRGARLVLMFEDDGIPFNPFDVEQPDVSLSAEERGIGGLGIHLVRETVDEYHYQRRAGKNVVVLVKQLGKTEASGNAGKSADETGPE